MVQVLPIQKGTGKNGEWKKQDIIVETDGTYPKKVCVSIWGDKINEAQLQPGTNLRIDFDVESREYNGRWYTDVKAWKVEAADAGGGTSGEGRGSAGFSSGGNSGGGQNNAGSFGRNAPVMPAGDDDDLPF